MSLRWGEAAPKSMATFERDFEAIIMYYQLEGVVYCFPSSWLSLAFDEKLNKRGDDRIEDENSSHFLCNRPAGSLHRAVLACIAGFTDGSSGVGIQRTDPGVGFITNRYVLPGVSRAEQTGP